MEPLERYREAAMAHGEASTEGNARRANRAFGRLTRIRQQLRQAGPEQARSILTLLDDESVFVRKAAAVDALELAPEAGVQVLRAIAEGPVSPTRGSADTLLDQWMNGTFEKTW